MSQILKRSQIPQIDSVRMTKDQSASTNSEIEAQVRRWLKNAKDREGGREQRMKKKCSSTPSPAEPEDDDN